MSIFKTNRSFNETLPDGTVRQRSYSRSAREMGKYQDSKANSQATQSGQNVCQPQDFCPMQSMRSTGQSRSYTSRETSPSQRNSKTDELIELIEEDIIDKKRETQSDHSRKTLIGMLAIALGSVLVISFSTYDDFKNYSSRNRIPSFLDSFWAMNVLIAVSLVAAALSTTKQIDTSNAYRTTKLSLFIGTCVCVVVACYNGFGNNNLQMSFWFAVGAFVLQVCNSLIAGFATVYSLLHLPLLVVSGFLIYIFWPGLNGQTAYSEDSDHEDGDLEEEDEDDE